MSQNADYWIQRLVLSPHPEGGYFKEVYRCEDVLTRETLPDRYSDDRSAATSIYFLLEGKQASKMHRIQSDEIWHHYEGSAIELVVVSPAGELTKKLLGKEEGQSPQLVIPHNHWFGGRVINEAGFALLGCSVSPGFDFEDFELADANNLPQELLGHQEALSNLLP